MTLVTTVSHTIFRWTEDDDVDEDSKSRKIIPKPSDYSSTDAENPFQQKYLKAMSTKAEGGQCKKGQEAPRKRRARCQTCPGCLGTDCQECAPCRQDFISYPVFIQAHPIMVAPETNMLLFGRGGVHIKKERSTAWYTTD